MSPSATAIRDQLERILSSDTFATAGRHSRLLRYLVERTLAGEGEQLKEYVLGTEVFDRADSYDPRLDSIVRVEVRRLRSRLEDYYARVGDDDSVIITIPRGSYVPVFTERKASPETTGVAPVATRDRSYLPVVIVAGVLAVAVVIAAGVAFNSRRAPAVQASTGPGIAVLPFEHYSTNEQDAVTAARITDAVTIELARLGTMSVASRTSASQYADGSHSIPEIAKALNVELVMEATAFVDGDQIHVVARLVNATRDRKVWAGEYDFRRSEIPAVSRRLAAEAAAAALR